MPEITGYAQGTPSWVELSITSDTAAVEFYGAIFGWVDDPQPMGPNMLYHMQKLNGLEAGAIYQQGDEEKGQGVPPHWNTYFTVNAVDEAAENARRAGGNVLFGPMDVFDAGRMAMLQDRQGAAFAVWQPKNHIGCRVKNETGAVTWNELITTDSRDAADFYAGVLGVEAGKAPGPMDYTMFRAGATDVAGIKEIAREMGQVTPNWMVYFDVANIDETFKQAESLGGKVLAPAMDIPGMGRFATLQDPQGAVFSVFSGQPTPA